MFRSPYLKRYCKECGNITHLVPKKPVLNSNQFRWLEIVVGALIINLLFMSGYLMWTGSSTYKPSRHTKTDVSKDT